MRLRAFHLDSAGVVSPRTSSFNPADIRHTEKPPSSTLTVLRAHLPLLSMIPHLSSFFGTRKPVYSKKQSVAHDGAEPLADCYLFLAHRAASRSARAPEGTRTHKHLGLPRMCISHPHPCFVLLFTNLFVHHPPPTAAYVLLWCRARSRSGFRSGGARNRR